MRALDIDRIIRQSLCGIWNLCTEVYLDLTLNASFSAYELCRISDDFDLF